jgi:hypothetical protein
MQQGANLGVVIHHKDVVGCVHGLFIPEQRSSHEPSSQNQPEKLYRNVSIGRRLQCSDTKSRLPDTVGLQVNALMKSL